MKNEGLGGKYNNFHEFTLKEIIQHNVLYIYQGISPSLQVEMNINSFPNDPVNGGGFIHRAFILQAAKAIRRHFLLKIFILFSQSFYTFTLNIWSPRMDGSFLLEAYHENVTRSHLYRKISIL